GGLIEMLPAQGAFMYPLTHIPKTGDTGHAMIPFRFCGPTCDSYDMMAGPFWLPDTVAEGDWIEIGMTGAYSNACRTNFNGFGAHKTLLMKAPPV
ncbi:MAG: type III PLP-dependent enzyme, partial [Pseudomonadota bacterium]